jgi:TRAP-type C4-dicarboxylate transport system permease small subunit
MSEEASEPPPPWTPTYPLIRRIDHLWFFAERVLCAAMFLVMGLMVFASVVTEIFGRRHQWSDVAILFGVCLLGVRTRAVKPGERKLSWPVSLGIAAALAAALAGLVYFYAREYPGGFIWAQKLALVMMIWVALLGASMATYDRSHLALEMGEKLWPQKVLPYIKALAHAVTAGFCVIAFYLSINLIQAQAKEGHTIPAVDWLPTWVAFLAMPYAFGAMTVRFLAQGVTTATKTAEPIADRMPS